MGSSEMDCDRCGEVRAIGHTCYDGVKVMPSLDVKVKDGRIIYSYDRNSTGLQPVIEEASEAEKGEGRESFTPVEK